MVPNWNGITEIDKNFRFPFCGPPRRGRPKTARKVYKWVTPIHADIIVVIALPVIVRIMN